MLSLSHELYWLHIAPKLGQNRNHKVIILEYLTIQVPTNQKPPY